MVAILNFIKKLLRLFIDLSFMVQIIITVIILAFALYWFFDLINCQYLAFLTPVADNITNFMHAYFEESLNKGANNTDGSIFIFIVFLAIVISLLTKVKNFSANSIKKVSRSIDKVKARDEGDFNAQLRAEADQAILEYKNIVLIVRLALKRRSIDDLRPQEEIEKEAKERQDALIGELYTRIKDETPSKFAKSGEQLVITLKEFSYVDKLLYSLDKALEEMREEQRKENWILKYYSVIDAFDDKVLLKDVYYDLQILMKLNLANEIICYGNFCNRYYLEPDGLFEAYLKGVYNTTEPENVWSLVKKY